MTTWLLLRFYAMALSLRYQGTPPQVRSLLALGRVMRERRRILAPVEFGEVPPPYVLSAGIEPAPRWPLRKVDCRVCGAPLRTGAKVAVRRLRPGVFEHVKCPARAKVPRGGRTLERSLRKSLEARS